MTIKKILPLHLKELMVNVLSPYINFSCDSSTMPFSMVFDKRKYFIYIKPISSACFPTSPDITRAQLPKRNGFAEIAKSDIAFILLGYDLKNEVFVCWNPLYVKSKLNSFENLSLYSRQSFQNEVEPNEFKIAYLTNGDKLVLFKRINLIEFFQQIDTFFTDEKKVIVEPKEPSKLIFAIEKLTKLTEITLIDQIMPLLRSYHTLEATTLVMNYYKEKFPKMIFKDYSLLIKQLKKNL